MCMQEAILFTGFNRTLITQSMGTRGKSSRLTKCILAHQTKSSCLNEYDGALFKISLTTNSTENLQASFKGVFDVHGCTSAAKGHDCRDAGGRATHGAVAEEARSSGPPHSIQTAPLFLDY